MIFHSHVSLPQGKSPFSYGFPMVFPFSYGNPRPSHDHRVVSGSSLRWPANGDISATAETVQLQQPTVACWEMPKRETDVFFGWEAGF